MIIRAIGWVLAYTICAIPAGLGVRFIAGYAFTTSDDALSAATQYGLVAAVAYAFPAISTVIWRRGSKPAAVVFAALALGCMLVNWSNVLDALANRGAGKEAERVKLSGNAERDNARLADLRAQRQAMVGMFTATDAEAVRAAKTASDAAARTRAAECGNGDPKQRGGNCRQRETEEQTKLGDLARAQTNKSQTDRASKLDADIAALAGKLDKAPAIRQAITGKALGRLLHLAAGDAESFQVQALSALVELCIAAILALPELLLSGWAPRREQKPPVAPNKPRLVHPVPTVSIFEFAPVALERVQGAELEYEQFENAYRKHCEAIGGRALASIQAIAETETLCGDCNIPIERRGKLRFLIGVRLKTAGRSRLGQFARKAT